VTFIETPLQGAYLIEIDQREDERGFFARLFCKREFTARGLASDFVQQSISYNRRRGTLRGLHFQREPKMEAKLVRCTRGSIWDVIVDLRSSSETLRRWHAEVLTQDNHCMLYVPPGFAHGFQTLEDDTEVVYLISEYYDSELAAGVRWDDPALGLPWPILPPTVISERDLVLPLT
jgi:dTDP-4-dehydrorhamnose 3,5-epimerase